MRSHVEHNGYEPGADREMHLLEEVERAPDTSQRVLSRKLGIGLGMTNLLLRNLARKGYIRATRAGWRNWIYTLTPAGMTRKVRLTLGYVHRVLEEYRAVRRALTEELSIVGLAPSSRVAIFGVGEFAELVYLGLQELGIGLPQFFGPVEGYPKQILGAPVLPLEDLNPGGFDWVIVATPTDIESSMEQLGRAGVTAVQMLTLWSAGAAARRRRSASEGVAPEGAAADNGRSSVVAAAPRTAL